MRFVSVVLLCGILSTAALAEKKADKKAAGGSQASAAVLDKGKALFNLNCAACHGEKGDGMGPAGAVMNPKPRNFAKDAFKQGDKFEDVVKSITTGVPGTAMVAYGHLSEDDRKAMAHWVLSLKAKK